MAHMINMDYKNNVNSSLTLRTDNQTWRAINTKKHILRQHLQIRKIKQTLLDAFLSHTYTQNKLMYLLHKSINIKSLNAIKTLKERWWDDLCGNILELSCKLGL